MFRNWDREAGTSADVKGAGSLRFLHCQRVRRPIRAEQYNLFREVVRSPDLSTWLQWDEQINQAGKKENLQRLFSWFSREDTGEEDVDSATLPSPEPVITKGADVRELARIINDENALRALDETRRLTEATFSSELMMRTNWLTVCVALMPALIFSSLMLPDCPRKTSLRPSERWTSFAAFSSPAVATQL